MKTLTVKSVDVPQWPESEKAGLIGRGFHWPNSHPYDRFWNQVKMAGPDECWEWTGVRHNKGYGIFQFSGRLIYAHRFSLLLHGVSSNGFHDHHVCENPPCVNPKHLNPMTNSDHARTHMNKRSGG